MRRRGVGTRLYRALFSDLPQERAILTVREENVPARQFYNKYEWEVIQEGLYSQSDRGSYFVMGKTLK